LQTLNFVNVVAHISDTGYAARHVEDSVHRLHVNVHIEEARHQGFPFAIDVFGIGWDGDCRGAAHDRDALAIDDYRLVFAHHWMRRIKDPHVFEGDRMGRMLRQFLCQPRKPCILRFQLQVLECLIGVLPTLPQPRKPFAGSGKEASIVIQPNGGGREVEASNREFSNMLLLAMAFDGRIGQPCESGFSGGKEFN